MKNRLFIEVDDSGKPERPEGLSPRELLDRVEANRVILLMRKQRESGFGRSDIERALEQSLTVWMSS